MSQNKSKLALLSFISLVFFIWGNAADKIEIAHNTRQDIDACKGKLRLKSVKIWGSDDEEDENKFFKSPSSVAMDRQGLVYICDMYNHNIKVFDHPGKYVRTIGRKGMGPGDTYCPSFITLSPSGDLFVSESGSRRIQLFSPLGISKKIIKLKGYIPWLAVTSDNCLVLYDRDETFLSGKLLYIMDEKGEKNREVGDCLEKVESILDMEPMSFTMDEGDNIYALNGDTPVIRKYAPDGRMILAITFDPPFDIPVKIAINDRGDDMVKKYVGDVKGRSRLVRSKNNTTIERTGKSLESLCKNIGIDSQKRIYIVTLKRIRTLDEIKKGPLILGGADNFGVEKHEYDLDREQDHLRLVVFNPAGKVIAEAPLTTYCTNIYINGNHLFIMDAFIGRCVREYEIYIEN